MVSSGTFPEIKRHDSPPIARHPPGGRSGLRRHDGPRRPRSMSVIGRNGSIVTYDTSATTPTPTTFASTGLDNPWPGVRRSGQPLRGQHAGNTIEKFTPGGVGSVFASTGLNSPDGLAFDAAGNLYVGQLWQQHDREVHAGRRRQRLRPTGLTNPPAWRSTRRATSTWPTRLPATRSRSSRRTASAVSSPRRG